MTSSNHYFHAEHSDQSILREGLQVGSATGNTLLLGYCAAYAERTGQSVDFGIDEIQTDNLRWLDTPLTDNDAGLPTDIVVRGKVVRATQQAKNIQERTGLMAYIGVPAYNEEGDLPKLISSFAATPSNIPVAFLAADNNSVDRTPQIVRDMGGNVTLATQQGIGPARQTALDRILAGVPGAQADRTIIVQTDADCLAKPGYLDSVAAAFDNDPDLQVGVGPAHYHIPMANGEVRAITNGKEYGELLGTTGLRGYFEELNRDANDYLLEPPYRYLIGPNTTFRSSLFLKHSIGYPLDNSWESLQLSVQVQQAVPSKSGVRYIEGQCMEVSSRAILGDNDVLTDQRIADIRAAGYVGTFTGISQAPQASMRKLIDTIDRTTYGLSDRQRIIGVVADSDPRAAYFPAVPARHSATRRHIASKVALISS